MRFGSVGGGGRYDDLVARFTGQQVPATGFSIGVSRLYSALKLVGHADEADALAPVVVLVMDKDRQGDYWRMVQQLRDAGIRAEMYVGTAGMKAQMKYADKRGAPLVVIQGGDEKARGEVQIKDLRLGAELASGIASRERIRLPAARAVLGAGGGAWSRRSKSAQTLMSPSPGAVGRRKARLRAMAGKSRAEREALERQNAAIMAVFERAGFDQIAPDIIQPADIFLERSGEDIRARTFVFTDPAGAEMCLRPDLTVPACRYHLSHAANPAAESALLLSRARPSASPTNC